MNISLEKTLAEIPQLDQEYMINISISKHQKNRHLFPVRIMDILISCISILVMAPVMLIAAISIKLSYPGPAIISYNRRGRNGKPFKEYMFRTMRKEHMCDQSFFYTEDALSSNQSTPGVGRLLKKLSFDKLPTLFNVLAGDMSLVGRSYILDRHNLKGLSKEIQNALFSLKPGIISLWTISYDRFKFIPERQILHDIRYLHERSFMYDLGILLRKVVVTFGKTATDNTNSSTV